VGACCDEVADSGSPRPMVHYHGITGTLVTDRFQVVFFLLEMKRKASARFRFEERQENMATLMSLGITKADAKTRVLALTVEDYCSGPNVRDPQRPDQESWEFGAEVHGRLVYVKLSIPDDPERCVCVSFHFPKYPMTLPFRPKP
jgi:hypothetical protein